MALKYSNIIPKIGTYVIKITSKNMVIFNSFLTSRSIIIIMFQTTISL